MNEPKKMHHLKGSKELPRVSKRNIRKREMINTQVYGFHAEGRTSCLNCAQRIYDDSLEMYLSAAAIQSLNDEDRPPYAHKGLLCDDGYKWIFKPEDIKESWWLVDPEPAEPICLLAFQILSR